MLHLQSQQVCFPNSCWLQWQFPLLVSYDSLYLSVSLSLSSFQGFVLWIQFLDGSNKSCFVLFVQLFFLVVRTGVMNFRLFTCWSGRQKSARGFKITSSGSVKCSSHVVEIPLWWSSSYQANKGT